MKKTTTYSILALCLMFTMSMVAQDADNISGIDPVDPILNGDVVTTGTYGDPAEGGPLFDNGPISNGNDGTNDLSIVENVTLGSSTYGFAVSASSGTAFRCADELTLPANATWDITGITLYGYQTGSPTAPSPIAAAYLQVWDGDPSTGTASVVWGDTTTDLLDSTTWSNTYRVLEDDQGSTARAIMEIQILTPGLSLDGSVSTEYWLDWSYDGDAAFSGPWQPTIAILGQAMTGNAIQWDGVGLFTPLADQGTGATVGLPFVVDGTETLSVEDNILEANVSLFPNPAQRDLTITNASNVELQNAQIFDVLGKVVMTIDLSDMSSQKTFDVSQLNSGIYMVQIQSNNGSTTKRLVKR